MIKALRQAGVQDTTSHNLGKRLGHCQSPLASREAPRYGSTDAHRSFRPPTKRTLRAMRLTEDGADWDVSLTIASLRPSSHSRATLARFSLLNPNQHFSCVIEGYPDTGEITTRIWSIYYSMSGRVSRVEVYNDHSG